MRGGLAQWATGHFVFVKRGVDPDKIYGDRTHRCLTVSLNYISEGLPVDRTQNSNIQLDSGTRLNCH